MLVWSNQLVLWNRDNFFYTIQCCWDIRAEVQSRNTSHTDDKTFCKVFYNDMFNGVSGTGISPAYGIRTTRTMTSSISEQCFPLIIPSATTQEISDSMEASIAIVNHRKQTVRWFLSLLSADGKLGVNYWLYINLQWYLPFMEEILP